MLDVGCLTWKIIKAAKYIHYRLSVFCNAYEYTKRSCFVCNGRSTCFSENILVFKKPDNSELCTCLFRYTPLPCILTESCNALHCFRQYVCRAFLLLFHRLSQYSHLFPLSCFSLIRSNFIEPETYFRFATFLVIPY